MRKIFSTLVILTGLMGISHSAPGDKPVVYVSVPPYKHLAGRLAGDAFEVRTIVSELDDPHSFSPTPKQVAQLGQAAIIFMGEMPFEEDIVAALISSNPKIVSHKLSANIELLQGSCEACAHATKEGHEDEEFVYVKGQDDKKDEHAKGESKHDHKDDAKHDHAEHAEHDHDHEHELDPHFWLSPKILKTQVVAMADVMKKVAPDAATQIDANLKTLVADLETLDAKLTEKLAFMKGQTFYVYHGAFAYFARDYGLKQQAIEVGSRRPEPKQIATLVEKAKKDGVKLVIVQPQFDQSSAKTLADAIGGQVIEVDNLIEDVFASLNHIADTVAQSAVKVAP